MIDRGVKSDGTHPTAKGYLMWTGDSKRNIRAPQYVNAKWPMQFGPVQVVIAFDDEADAIRLGQAINNLLDNALKYTPAGGTVTLTTMIERGPGVALVSPCDHLVITVADTGPGVPVAERAAIWRRLYRGDSSRSQRGLGLGLSLVKAIVEAHGGTVAITDAPRAGARFTLRLPVERDLAPR